MSFVPLIKRGNSGRPSAMPNYFGFYGIVPFLVIYPIGLQREECEKTGRNEGMEFNQNWSKTSAYY